MELGFLRRLSPADRSLLEEAETIARALGATEVARVNVDFLTPYADLQADTIVVAKNARPVGPSRKATPEMRQRAAESDIVIVNHHLLCADAAVREHHLERLGLAHERIKHPLVRGREYEAAVTAIEMVNLLELL
mgnify:CR=1 FL=1